MFGGDLVSEVRKEALLTPYIFIYIVDVTIWWYEEKTHVKA